MRRSPILPPLVVLGLSFALDGLAGWAVHDPHLRLVLQTCVESVSIIAVLWLFDVLLRALENGRRRWVIVLIRVSFFIPAAVLALGHVGPKGGPIPVFAGLLAASSLFESLGDALVLVTARVSSIRHRLAVMAVMATLIGMLVAKVLHLSAPGATALERNLFSVGVALLCILMFSRVVGRRLTEPLERLLEGIRKVGGGDLSTRVSHAGRDEVAELSSAFNAMASQLEDRAFIEQAFGRYVTPSILERLRADRSTRLAAVVRDATILYTDVRGFTAMSEQLAPAEVLRILNAYFERAISVIAAHEGYLDKFIGDAVMVIFNAPHDQADHARRAVSCAIALQRAMAELNREDAFGGGRVLRIGVGVNTGPLVAGTLGSDARAEYTVIGDTVNVAARLTSVASAGEILVGERTSREAGLPVETLPPVPLKGKSEPVPVFRVNWAADSVAA